MAYTMLGFRVLVEADSGKTDRGTVVEGFAPSTIEWSDLPEGQPRVGTKIYLYPRSFCNEYGPISNSGWYGLLWYAP